MATQKPLLSIGVADVGIAARHVEANLSKIFALATKWDAILLLLVSQPLLSRNRIASVPLQFQPMVYLTQPEATTRMCSWRTADVVATQTRPTIMHWYQVGHSVDRAAVQSRGSN